MRLIVFGSRTWSDVNVIHADLAEAYALGYRVLVHGACPSGADYFADREARDIGFRVERHPADWNQYGKAAGPIRNEHMCTLGADCAIGYRMQGESRGTDGMAELCARYGIPVVQRGWWS